MGNHLSEPETTKNTARCQNANYQVGSSSMQGWRSSMEDAHTHILSLPDDPDAAFFAVYDGHCGSKTSEYASKHLHNLIPNREEYKNGDMGKGIKQAFLEIDRVMLEDESLKNDKSGSTAVAIIIKNGLLYCANVGDSRAVASIGGRAEPLSNDHKPNKEEEMDRIVAGGGWVDIDTVNGNLAMSRALGDFIFKRNQGQPQQEQIVTAYPEVQVYEVTPELEFVVIACDGIWEVMSNEKVVVYVRERIASGVQPEEICESLMMKCLTPKGSCTSKGCDNMTVVIVGLLQGGTYEELSSKCARTYITESLDEEDISETEDEEDIPESKDE
jgi:protein phosphatase 2C family protein 2/3